MMVSVVISAKDEADSLSSLIHQIKQALSTTEYEIIVVDDGSKDGTKDIACSNGATVISHGKNRGKGAAMKTGVKNATGDIVVFLDGDGAHDPQDIPRVIAPIIEGRAEIVNGSRTLPESEVPICPFTRRLLNSMASFVISMIVSFVLPLATLFKCPVKYIRITDCTSGFRAVKRDAWEKLDLVSQGFQIETEMIYEAARQRLVIAEAPISCNWDSRLSRLSILRDGSTTLTLLARKLIGDIGGR